MDWYGRVGFIDRQRIEDILDKVLAVRGENYVDPGALMQAHYEALVIEHERNCDCWRTTYCADYPQGGNNCSYFADHSEMPSCIVGHVLYEMGVRAEDIADHAEDSVEELALGMDMPITSAALFLLGTAQQHQDQARTWGDVVANSRAALNATCAVLQESVEEDEE